MADNDYFAGEVASNLEESTLCMFVIDTSGSMRGEPIQELNRGMREFYEEIKENDKMAQCLEVGIVEFNTKVELVQKPALCDEFELKEFCANGLTKLCTALDTAIDVVDQRKKWWREQGKSYKRPWIILITDGEPDDGQDVDGIAEKIKEGMNSKHFFFLPLAVQGANMEILKKINLGKDALPLKGKKFSEFFQWLSNSIGKIIEANKGDNINIAEGMDTFLNDFGGFDIF